MKGAGKVLTGKLDELRRDLRVLQPAQQRRGLSALARPVEPFNDDEGTALRHGEGVVMIQMVVVKSRHASSLKRAQADLDPLGPTPYFTASG